MNLSTPLPPGRPARATRWALRLTLAGGLAALAVFSCYSDRSTLTEPSAADCTIPGSAIGPNRTVVLIRGFAFLPDTLRVRRGTRVTWVNCEAATVEMHTSTSDDAWDSGPLLPGESYARDFATPGAFDYKCSPHPFMRGTILVE